MKQLLPIAYIPQQSTPGTAGFEVKNCHSMNLIPYSVTKIHTGLACEIQDPTLYHRVALQSSLSLRHITAKGGVIDSDFCEEIIIILKKYIQNNQNKRTKKGGTIDF